MSRRRLVGFVLISLPGLILVSLFGIILHYAIFHEIPDAFLQSRTSFPIEVFDQKMGFSGKRISELLLALISTVGIISIFTTVPIGIYLLSKTSSHAKK